MAIVPPLDPAVKDEHGSENIGCSRYQKDISHPERSNRERAFVALYVDGKPVGRARDRAWGGVWLSNFLPTELVERAAVGFRE